MGEMLDVKRTRAFHEGGKEESETTCSIAQQVSLLQCDLPRLPLVATAGARMRIRLRRRSTDTLDLPSASRLSEYECIASHCHSPLNPSELAYQKTPLTRTSHPEASNRASPPARPVSAPTSPSRPPCRDLRA